VRGRCRLAVDHTGVADIFASGPQSPAASRVAAPTSDQHPSRFLGDAGDLRTGGPGPGGLSRLHAPSEPCRVHLEWAAVPWEVRTRSVDRGRWRRSSGGRDTSADRMDGGRRPDSRLSRDLRGSRERCCWRASAARSDRHHRQRRCDVVTNRGGTDRERILGDLGRILSGRGDIFGHLPGIVEAWELGVSIREYQELEAGARWPSWETFDRICKVFRVVRGRRFMSSHLRESHV